MSGLMRLFYPQWQGSDQPQLHSAALALHALLPQPWGVSVPVTRDKKPMAHRVHQYASIRKQQKAAADILRTQQPDRVLTLGGDCNTAIVPVNYLHRRYPNDLVLVWIDQHADLNTPASSPSGNFHGMPVRHIIGEGESTLMGSLGAPLSPARVVYVGAGDLDDDERATIERYHMPVLGVGEVTDDMDLLGRLLRRKGAKHAYIHVDADCLDTREFNGTLYPNPRGLYFEELMGLLDTIQSQVTVVGAGLTSYSTTDATQLARLVPLVERLEGMML